jgi:hypothetical protein
MKEVTSFYCNLDYLLIPIKITELSTILKKGLKPSQICDKNYFKTEPLLPIEEPGVYSVAIFRQWKNNHMSILDIHNIDKETEVVIKLDKSVVLYTPFHFNKTENNGMRDIGNTLESEHTYSQCSNVWKYDVIRNLHNIRMNELVFHKTIHPDFIKEIWYFTNNHVPIYFYNQHIKVKLINNEQQLL